VPFFVVSLGLGFATRGDVESSPKYENLKGLRGMKTKPHRAKQQGGENAKDY
jgi:hypothetical protein